MTQGRVLQEAFSFHFPFVIAICFYGTSFFHTFPYDYNLHNPTNPYQFLTHPIAKKKPSAKIIIFWLVFYQDKQQNELHRFFL